MPELFSIHIWHSWNIKIEGLCNRTNLGHKKKKVIISFNFIYKSTLQNLLCVHEWIFCLYIPPWCGYSVGVEPFITFYTHFWKRSIIFFELFWVLDHNMSFLNCVNKLFPFNCWPMKNCRICVRSLADVKMSEKRIPKTKIVCLSWYCISKMNVWIKLTELSIEKTEYPFS